MTKWHHAPTRAGNPMGRVHYDIGGDDCSNVAIVYPSEDGDEDTLRKARVITASQELLEFAEQIFNGIDTGMIRMNSPADETLVNVLARGRNALYAAKGHETCYSPPVLSTAKGAAR